MPSKQYAGVWKILSRYWFVYGGWAALRASPYVHWSLVVSVLCAGFWFERDWSGQALQVLPNLLGFTLGGFAVFLGFGDEKFRQLITGSKKDDNGADKSSPYLNMSVTFLHFVLVQVAALLWAIIAAAMHSIYIPLPESLSGVGLVFRACGDGVGYWLFVYSILSAAAAAIAVFRTAWWFDSWQGNKQTTLIQCKHCGDEVSEQAAICPKCGVPKPGSPSSE